MLCSLPRWPDPCRMLSFDALPRRFFRIDSSSSAGSTPYCAFPGLLELYSRCGLPGCSPTFLWTFHRASTEPVSPSRRLLATEPNLQLFRWVLPPLVISPFGAHAEAPRKLTKACPTIGNETAGRRTRFRRQAGEGDHGEPPRSAQVVFLSVSGAWPGRSGPSSRACVAQ